MNPAEVALGDLCVARSSMVDPTQTKYRNLPHIAPDNVERDTGRLLPFRTVAEDGVTSGKYLFEAGDLIYSKIRPNLNKLAQVGFSGLCSADMYALQVDRARAAPEFIAHLLRSRRFLDYATSLSNRANIPKLNRGQLMDFRFALPPLDEQRRIAAILDQASALRAKYSQALAHLDDLTASIFYDMFGDPSDAQQMIRFGDVATLSAGRNLVASDSKAESEYRVIKISAVTTGRFRAEESKPLPVGYVPPPAHLIRDGDLLMSRANTTDLVGAVAVVEHAPPNLALPDKVWRFEWLDSRSVPVFFHALFRTGSIRRRISRMSSGTGGSMKNVSKSKLVMALIEIPQSCSSEFLRSRGQVSAGSCRS